MKAQVETPDPYVLIKILIWALVLLGIGLITVFGDNIDNFFKI